MSEINIGSQSQTFDFRLPIKAAKFNRLLRSINKPGVYKGMTLSFTGSTVIVDMGSVLINCKFNNDDNLTMKIDFDSIIVQENVLQTIVGQNEVVYLSFEFGEIIDNYADLKFTPLSNWLASPDPNGIVLGEIEFNNSTPYNITGVNYTRKTWGLTNADADDTFNDEVIYSDTDNTNKRWKIKGGNLFTGVSILDFQNLSELAARILLTNSTNTTIVENKLSINGVTDSTSTSTGTLIISGGVGIAKRLNVGQFDGRVPLGAVIPVVGTRSLANNGGTSITPTGIPATGVISDDGFQRCDGSAVGSGATLTGFVPDLTDNRFIQGSSSLGTLGGNSNNQVTLSVENLATHTHTDNGHTHTFPSLGATIGDLGYGIPGVNGAIDFASWNNLGKPSGIVTLSSPSPATAGVAVSQGLPNGTSFLAVNVIKILGQSVNPANANIQNTGSSTPFDIRPLFMNAIYLMRVR